MTFYNRTKGEIADYSGISEFHEHLTILDQVMTPYIVADFRDVSATVFLFETFGEALVSWKYRKETSVIYSFTEYDPEHTPKIEQGPARDLI